MSVPLRHLYVCGEWVKPIKGGTLDVINPATEEIIGQIPAATREDVLDTITKAVAAAKSGHWTKVRRM